MTISPQRLTIYLYSAHRAVIFAIAQLSCKQGRVIWQKAIDRLLSIFSVMSYHIVLWSQSWVCSNRRPRKR